MDKNKKLKHDAKFIFWIGIAVIGIGAFIAGLVLRVMNDNPLMWLVISLGLILMLLGTPFSIYLGIIKYKQRKIVSKGI